MKKGVKKQMAAVALSLLTVSGIGLSGANVIKAASPLKNKATINITAKKVRKAVTKTSSCSIKKRKKYLGWSKLWRCSSINNKLEK